MEKKLTILDGGTIKEQIEEMKDFFGLSQEQTFQDIEVDENEE